MKLTKWLHLGVSLSALVSTLAESGCSDDFDPASRVVNLRILAVQADRPFAKPGEDVQLTSLYHDPEDRPLSWAFGPCATENSSSALSCAQNIELANMTIGSASTHTVHVPEHVEGSTGSGDYLGIAVVACPGTIVAGETAGIPLRCLDARGEALDIHEFEVGMKRIFVHEDTTNQNPVIEMVLWDGERWPEGEEREASCDKSGNKCKKHTLEVRAPYAQEKSVDADGEPIEEHAIVQFYATGGTFEDDVLTLEEQDTTWKPRQEDRGQLFTMWFVVRDDRGGVSWTERKLRVR